MNAQNESPLSESGPSQGTDNNKHNSIVTETAELFKILNKMNPDRYPDPLKAGDIVRCPHPDHPDRNPSARIYNHECGHLYFECQSRRCHRKALTAKQLIIHHLGVSELEAVKFIKEGGIEGFCDVRNRYKMLMPRLYDFFRSKFDESEAAQQYLADRGLPDLKVGYAPSDWVEEFERLTEGLSVATCKEMGLIAKSKDTFSPILFNRIIFPIHDSEGTLQGLQGRAIGDQQPKYLTVGKQNVTGLSDIDNAEIIFVVEGVIDAESLKKAGITPVVAFLGANAVDHATLKILKDTKAEIIVLADNDPIKSGGNAGQKFYQSIAAGIGERASMMSWPQPGQINWSDFDIERDEEPDDLQDANSMLQFCGDSERFNQFFRVWLDANRVTLIDHLTQLLRGAELDEVDQVLNTVKKILSGIQGDAEFTAITKRIYPPYKEKVGDTFNAFKKRLRSAFERSHDQEVNGLEEYDEIDGVLYHQQSFITTMPPVITAVYEDCADSTKRRIDWEFTDSNGKIKKQSNLATELFDKNNFANILHGAGLVFDVASVNSLLSYFVLSSHLQYELCASRVGWDSYTEPKIFCTPDVVYGSDEILVQFEAPQYQIKGDLEIWTNLVRKVKGDSLTMFALFCSAASLLLPLINKPGFTVVNEGKASRGKTTIAGLAASLMGDPARLIMGGGVTKDRFTKELEGMGGCSAFVDDLHKWSGRGNSMDTQTLPFMIYEGKGKLTGGIGDSIGKDRKFKSMLWATSNEPIFANSQGDGDLSRVLEFNALPFTEESGEIIQEIQQVASMNYGVAGQKFLTELFNEKELWPSFPADADVLVKQWDIERDGKGDHRRSHLLATAEFGGLKLNQYLDLNMTAVEVHNVVKYILNLVEMNEDTPNLDHKNIRLFYDFCRNNERFFQCRQLDFRENEDPDKDKWDRDLQYTSYPIYGRYFNTFDGDEEYYAILKKPFEDYLKKEKINVNIGAVVKELIEKGVIIPTSSGKTQHTIRIYPGRGASRMNCWKFLPGVAEKLLGIDKIIENTRNSEKSPLEM